MLGQDARHLSIRLRSALLLGSLGVGLLAGCGQSAATPSAAPSAPDARATIEAAVAATVVASRPAAVAAPAAPAALPTPSVSDEVMSEAIDLLGAAISQREQGQLGTALQTTHQSLRVWPQYPDALAFLSEIGPLAAAQAREAAVQATAQAEQSRAQATAQAQAQAQAQAAAQATAGAQAAAQATADALPRVGRAYTSGNWEYTVNEVRRIKELKQTYNSEVAKGEFVIAGVTVKNVGRENFGLNTWDFELFDGQGIKYKVANVFGETSWAKANGYAGGTIGGSNSSQMPPGVPLKFAVIFDVAPGSQGLKLHLVQAKTHVSLDGAAPVAAASGAPAPAADTASGTVSRFYSLVTARQFTQAYQLLAADVRREYPSDRFQTAYADLISATPVVVRELTSNASGATVWACVAMNRPTGTQNMAGEVKLVRESGAFRVSTSALKAQPSCAA